MSKSLTQKGGTALAEGLCNLRGGEIILIEGLQIGGKKAVPFFNYTLVFFLQYTLEFSLQNVLRLM
jgi:hypothetical protein